jgi:hypothetical protein
MEILSQEGSERIKTDLFIGCLQLVSWTPCSMKEIEIKNV